MTDSSLSRRTLLKGTAGLGVVASLAADAGAATEPAPSDDRRLPDRPYITLAHGAPLFRPRDNLGWTEQSPSDRVRTIYGLHPDFLDHRRLVWANGRRVSLPPGVEQQARFSEREGLPATVGQTIYLLVNGDVRRRIGWLWEQQDWTLPNGDPVDEPEQLLGRQFDGSVHGFQVQGGARGVPSVFAPATVDVLLHEAVETHEDGFVSMFADSVTTPRLQGLDFSRWARAGFREYLATLPASERAALGVDDVDAFDVRDAFRERGIAPEDDRSPLEDPLFREYTLFHHRGMKGLLRAYRDGLAEAFPERDEAGSASLNANHYIGEEFGNSPAAAVYTMDPVDFVTVEDNRTKPPEYVREPLYKLVKAATRGEKPGLVEGQMHSITGSDTTRGLDLDRPYYTLRRLQFAEAYANGVPRKVPLTSWGNVDVAEAITNWVDADGSVPEELQSFVDFLWTNRRFLDDPTPDNEVALVFSMPTMLWHRAPQWEMRAERERAAFLGAAASLRHSQVPYDVVVFGHPQLWNDEAALDGLGEYDAVVLPDVDCLSSAQSTALSAHLDDGGTVVTTGRRPSRTANYEPTAFDWLDRDGVSHFDASPEYRDDGDDGDGGQSVPTHPLGESLADAASVAVDRPAPLAVNRLTKGGTTQVHLLNYDYDEAADEVAPVRDVTVSVADCPSGACRYITPNGVEEPTVATTDGRVEVTVPEVREWGFLVFATDPAAMAPAADPETVAARRRDLWSTIDDAEITFEIDEARVEALRSEVDTAIDAGATDRAVERLDRLEAAVAEIGLGDDGATPTASPTATPTGGAGTATDGATGTGARTETAGPGFGLATAIGGVAGALAVLRHVGDRDD